MPDFPERISSLQPFWGAWYLDAPIGEGGFGKVYRIYRDEFGTRQYAALKWIALPSNQSEITSMRAQGMSDIDIAHYLDGQAQELQSEINLMSSLRGSKHVVGYEDHAIIPRRNEMGWDILIRMELLTALPQRLVAGMTVGDVVRMGIDLCDALSICASMRIIHRDIKPDNIFVNSAGDYKLGDFGVARRTQNEFTHMSIKGTPVYMAPEVYSGKTGDNSVDQYSLGLVMHRLLNAHQIPFAPAYDRVLTHEEREQAFAQRLGGANIPPPIQGSDKLKAAVCKACSFQARRRYSSPDEFRKALEATLNDPECREPLLTMSAAKINSVRSTLKPPKKKGLSLPLLLTLAGIVVLTAVLVVILVLAMSSPNNNDTATDTPPAATTETITDTPEPTDTPTPEPAAISVPEATDTPTPEPTATPSPEPTATPSPEPTATPSPEPTATPSPEPTATPSPEPTATPSPEPTATPSPEPTATPSPEPTATPTPEPTATPSPEPTATPTPEPTATPTPEPTPTPVPTATPTPEPTATPRTFEITSASSSKGAITISWTDSAGMAPYKVFYKISDPNAVASQGKFIAGEDESDAITYKTSFTYDGIAPGHYYTIFVEDANGEEISQDFKPAKVEDFSDGALSGSSIKVSTEYRRIDPGQEATEAKEIGKFSASEMESGIAKGYSYGLYYRIDMPQLSRDRSYETMIVFTAPNGYVQTAVHKNVTYPRYNNGKGYHFWYCTGDAFFAELNRNNGGIPSGTYTVDLYWDGMLVNTSSFSVSR